MNLHIIIFNMYTGGSEYRIIEGTESIEVLRVHFGGTVAAHQVVFEEDADFGYDGLSVGVAVGGYFDAGQQVFLPSVRSTPMGSCEPVRMTGLFSPSSMKLSAEAV